MSEAVIKARSGEYDLEQVRYLSLERLSLSSLDLSDAVCRCTGLVELSLARNCLTADVSVIGRLQGLRRLDLSYNQLRSVDGLDLLPQLEWLDLRANAVASLDGIVCLAKIDSLHTLFLQAPTPSAEDQNPLCQYPAYSNSVFRSIPQLNVLDGTHLLLESVVDDLETRMAALKPDLTQYPHLEAAQHWFSDSDLYLEAVQLGGSSTLVASSVPHSFHAVEDGIDDLEQILSHRCAQSIDKAEVVKRKCDSLQ
jgi:hypothetical protein